MATLPKAKPGQPVRAQDYNDMAALIMDVLVVQPPLVLRRMGNKVCIELRPSTPVRQ